MFSDDGEYVNFVDVLILNGPAEKWLSMIEVAMRITLKDQLRSTRKSLKKMMSARDKWLALWPGQLCLTSSKIQWTSDCTRNLTICKIAGMKKPLKKLRRKQNSVLMKLSDMSRKELPKQMRLKVNTLITIEIHGRDVIDKMYKMSKCSIAYCVRSGGPLIRSAFPGQTAPMCRTSSGSRSCASTGIATTTTATLSRRTRPTGTCTSTRATPVGWSSRR